MSALEDAFAQVGIVGSRSDADADADAEAEPSVRLPDNCRLQVRVETASLPSSDWARGINVANDLVIVVADQIPNGVRQELNDRGIGWLDRRGRLRIVRGGVFIDTDVPPAPRLDSAASSRPAISGRSGLAAAAALMLRPDDPMGVSEVARQASLNASSMSRAMTAQQVDARSPSRSDRPRDHRSSPREARRRAARSPTVLRSRPDCGISPS